MKKFTKLMLTLAMLIVGVGGATSVMAETIITKTPVLLTGGKFAECFVPGTYVIQMQGWQNFIAYEDDEGVAFDENSFMQFDMAEACNNGSVRVTFTFSDESTQEEWWCLGIGESASDTSTPYGHAFDNSKYWIKKGLGDKFEAKKSLKIKKVTVNNFCPKENDQEIVVTYKVNGGTICGKPMTIKNNGDKAFGAYGGVFTATAAQSNIFKMENFEVGDYQKVVIKFGEAVPSDWAYNYQSGVLPPSIPVGATELEIPLDGNNLPELTIFNWNENPDPINISEVYLYKEETIVVVDDPEPDAPEGSTLIKVIDYSTQTSYPYYQMGKPEGSSYDVESGALLISNTKTQTNNHDLQPFIIDNVTLKEGYDYVVRIKMKATSDGSATIPMGTWQASMSQTLNFAQSYGYTYYDLSFTKSTVANANEVHVLFQCGKFIGTVNIGKVEVFEIAPDDPLLTYKQDLQAAIANANGRTLGKTEASASTLSNAITAGQTALNATDATAESLTNAKNAIDDAIKGLKYAAGYAKVTKDMFMTWDKDDADAKATGKSPAGADNIGVENAGVPYGYGTGNIYWNHYTDLTPYEKLYAIGTKGKRARYVFNRPQDPSNPTGEGTSGFVQKYIDIDENGVAELTLSEVGDFAHLNSFKRPDEGTTFTEFFVYAANTTAKVGEAGYATFSSIMNVDLSDVTGYAAQYDGSKVNLTQITEYPAGAAIIIEAAEGSYSLTNIESADAIANNDLKVSDGSIAGDGTIYVLAKKSDVVGFYKLKDGEKVPAGKAYLKIAATSREFIAIDGGATAIKSVETEKANGAVYNLAGQQVKNAQKGVFIMNGKKVIK